MDVFGLVLEGEGRERVRNGKLNMIDDYFLFALRHR